MQIFFILFYRILAGLKGNQTVKLYVKTCLAAEMQMKQNVSLVSAEEKKKSKRGNCRLKVKFRLNCTMFFPRVIRGEPDNHEES